jgi:hypothetical protein
VSSALAFQVIPNVVIGADLWYLRHYEGLSFGSFSGDTVYLGPTFFWKIGPKTLITASWEAQVAGREIGGPSPLNLTDFSRQRARLLLEFEFSQRQSCGFFDNVDPLRKLDGSLDPVREHS